MRTLIKEADPDVVEEWKWEGTTGTPVWSHDGIICTGESYKAVVKLTFVKGASLEDPAGLFNSSLDGTPAARSTSTRARRSTRRVQGAGPRGGRPQHVRPNGSLTCGMRVRLDDLSRLNAQLDGVAERRRDGSCSIGAITGAWSPANSTPATSSSARRSTRDFLVKSFPETFSVPERFTKHMMVVADLNEGNAEAIEDAVIGAWELQSGR